MRITAILAVFLVGCSQNEPTQIEHPPQPQVVDMGIRSGPPSDEIMEADAESRVSDDDEWSLPYKDRELITALVKSASNDPILDIITIGPFHVQVTIGVIKGALSGGGDIFECKKTDGKWRIVREWKWVS